MVDAFAYFHRLDQDILHSVIVRRAFAQGVLDHEHCANISFNCILSDRFICLCSRLFLQQSATKLQQLLKQLFLV